MVFRETDPQVDSEIEVKALGMVWKATSDDTLSYKSLDVSMKSQPTKCALAADVARVYDPLGLALPTTHKGRVAQCELATFERAASGTKQTIAQLKKQLLPHMSVTKSERAPLRVQLAADLKKSVECDNCRNGTHKIGQCNTFQQLPLAQKWDWLLRLNICTRCLSKGHDSLDCKSTTCCKAKGCNQSHHMSLHQHALSWDTDLSIVAESSPEVDAVLKRWTSWLCSLPDIPSITVPRSLPQFDQSNTAICIFSNGSKVAYGACAYLRITHPDGYVSVHLLACRSRMAPLLGRSIPALKLMGALLGAVLGRHLLRLLQLTEIHYFTDATTICHWIANPYRDHPTFIYNRVVDMVRKYNVESFLHISTEENPADVRHEAIKGQALRVTRISSRVLHGYDNHGLRGRSLSMVMR